MTYIIKDRRYLSKSNAPPLSPPPPPPTHSCSTYNNSGKAATAFSIARPPSDSNACSSSVVMTSADSRFAQTMAAVKARMDPLGLEQAARWSR